MNAKTNRALDANEKALVDQSKKLDGLSHRELTDLAKQLRSRRERVRRMIRDRNRAARKSGSENPDAGAHEKKTELVAAIDRVNAALESRTHANRATQATENLKAAVKRKAKSDAAKQSDNKTADEGPAETPNKKIAPSGALNAEGRIPAAKRAGPR